MGKLGELPDPQNCVVPCPGTKLFCGIQAPKDKIMGARNNQEKERVAKGFQVRNSLNHPSRSVLCHGLCCYLCMINPAKVLSPSAMLWAGIPGNLQFVEDKTL